MTDKTSTPKILRVGLVQKGKVIDERLLRQKSAVTVGESHRNTFVIPAMNFPPRFPLFEVKNDTYYLNYPEWMHGKLHQGQTAFTLAHACESKMAQPSGHVRFAAPGETDEKPEPVTVYQIALNDASRGVIHFGDFALLFQFVTPPPERKDSPLPAALRGGLWKGVDWVYSSILLLSFVAHTGFIYWVKMTGELPPNAPSITDRFAPDLYCKNCKKPKKPDNSWLQNKEPKKPTARPGPKPKPTRSRSQRRRTRLVGKARQKRGKPRTISLEQARRTGVLAMLVSKGKAGKHKDMLAAGEDAGKNLDKFLAKTDILKTPDTSIQNNRGSRRGQGLVQKDQTIGESAPDSGGILGTKTTGRKWSKIDIKPEKIDVDGDLPEDVGAVMKRIHRYRRSLQYCYELALKRAPGLRGKMLFGVTVALSGRVSSVDLEENGLNRQAARCMTKAIKRWRLFRPKRGAVTLSIPFVFFAR